MPHRYTKDQVDFLKNNVKGRSRKELRELFNNEFKLQLSLNQIIAFIKNNKLKNGLDARFKSGNIPFNKGKKGFGGHEPTQFKKGNRPHNYKPIGTERIRSGYVDVKIAAPNIWRAKHLVVWEEANGPVPKGHVVMFGDGNRRNFSLDNLLLIKKGQLTMLNRKSIIRNDAELTKIAIMVAEINKKIYERKKAK